MFHHVQVGNSIRIDIYKTFSTFWRIFGIFPITENTLDGRNHYKLATLNTIIIFVFHITVLLISWIKVYILDSQLQIGAFFIADKTDDMAEYRSTMDFMCYIGQICVHFVGPIIYREKYSKFVNALFATQKRLSNLQLHVKMDKQSAISYLCFIIVSFWL
jgi:hypothetical protein